MKGSKLIVILLMLLFLLTSAVFADTLEYGNRGVEVTGLQKQLKELGYFTGSATGYFGSKTQTAVKKFQAAKGISTTGTVGPLTTKALEAAAVKNSVTDRTAIRKVQEILGKMGLYKGKIDGLTGKLTSSAVKEFQNKNGMTATGVLDKETESRIVNHYASTVISSRGAGSASAVRNPGVQSVIADIKTQEPAAMDLSAAEASTETDVQVTGAADGTAEAEAAPELISAAEDEASTEDEKASATDNAGAASENEGEKSEESDSPRNDRKIEVLDWWKAANSVFARGSTARVIDVGTGKSFYIKRTYGGNHADCETLTKEDTKIMKDIWGGFSWNRRPVLVEVDGRLLAASMAGMPHAGLDNKPTNSVVSSRSGGYGRGVNLDAVKNNGMNGHFDIHFKNSRTHGSNKVDPAHQKAIEKAAAARL